MSGSDKIHERDGRTDEIQIFTDHFSGLNRVIGPVCVCLPVSGQ